MKTIDESYYRLEGVLNLLARCSLDGLLPRRTWLRRLAYLENLNNYYRFAVSAVRLFQESSSISLDKLVSPKRENFSDFDDKSHSSALAFYSHARICIESSGILSQDVIFSSENEETIILFQAHRDKYRKLMGEIVNKRNLVAAHPHDSHKMIVGPNGWGTDGKVRFGVVDLERAINLKDDCVLDPCQDLDLLKEYLEKTISYLKQAWK